MTPPVKIPGRRTPLRGTADADNSAGDLTRKYFSSKGPERDISLWIQFRPERDALDFSLQGIGLRHGNSLHAQAPRARELMRDMHELRREWENAIHDYYEPGPDGRQSWRPFFSETDFRGASWDPSKELLPAMAAYGRDAFNTLFSSDRGALESKDMAALREVFLHMLTSSADESGCCLITIRPDRFYAPWPLLCVPPPGADPDGVPDKEWFLGYRHQIEVRTSQHDNLPVELRVERGGRPSVAAIVDRRLDESMPLDRCTGLRLSCVEPVLEAARAVPAAVDEYETLEAVRRLLRQGACGVHLLYLGCHCEYDAEAGPLLHLGRNPRGGSGPGTLGRVQAEQWAAEAGQPMLAVLNSCRGGLAHRELDRGFVESLRAKGWFSALAAPETEIPIRFLGEYGRRFFEEFLGREDSAPKDVGTVVRLLAREFVDERHNPLGLLYCVHRNLETHLCREDLCPVA